MSGLRAAGLQAGSLGLLQELVWGLLGVGPSLQGVPLEGRKSALVGTGFLTLGCWHPWEGRAVQGLDLGSVDRLRVQRRAPEP